MSQFVNRRDLAFHLYHVEGLEGLLQTPRYNNHDREIVDAVLDTAEKIAEDYYLPVASKLDANEPVMRADGGVDIIPEVAAGIEAFKDAGFFAAGFPEDLGGAQLPFMVNSALQGMFTCANAGMCGYQFLTTGAANMLSAFGSQAQKDTFLPHMLAGEWFGTMCLSEPQAGSSLADITTKATPTDAGHYLINGTKMWISGGEQEISDNIVHMVLAKIPGGPDGVKGISLFIVPKFRVTADGGIGEKNNVALAGLNHKMGHRGTTNTLLNFGEAGECHGYLVGEPHKGLMYMFHMMNEARIGVGMGATMSGLAGYLYSLQYAKERPQGRSATDKDPTSKPLSIIEHADIKRLLLAQKGAVEGSLSLLLYCAGLLDRQAVTDSAEEKQALGMLLDLLTPIAKSWPSEFCLEANKHAIQILGGYGYTREYPVERHYRDNRLNHIHEGTHGIQGMDLLGRKVVMANGAALKLLVAEMDKTIAEAGTYAELAGLVDAFQRFKSHMAATTMTVLGGAADPSRMLANATMYLDGMGHGVIAWMWLRQAVAALANNGDLDADFVTGKLTAAKYFMTYELPKATAWLDVVASLDDTCLTMPEASFL